GRTLYSGRQDGTLKLWSLPFIRKELKPLGLGRMTRTEILCLARGAGPNPSQAPCGFLARQVPLAQPGLQQLLEGGVVFEQLVDQVVVLCQRDQLEGGDAVDRDDDRFLVAEPPVVAQAGLGLTQRDHFHGVRYTPLPGRPAGSPPFPRRGRW